VNGRDRTRCSLCKGDGLRRGSKGGVSVRPREWIPATGPMKPGRWKEAEPIPCPHCEGSGLEPLDDRDAVEWQRDGLLRTIKELRATLAETRKELAETRRARDLLQRRQNEVIGTRMVRPDFLDLR
jgi:hypothetical protein